MSPADLVDPVDLTWHCARCRRPLDTAPVAIEYLGHRFTVELPQCPQCNQVYVSEALATGKMAEVEQLLEDK